MKKVLALIMCAAMTMSLTACGGSGSGTASSDTATTEAAAASETSGTASSGNAQYSFRLGHSQADGNVIDQAVRYFCEEVNTRTNGAVEIVDYPGMQLGDDIAMMESVQMGTLDFAMVPTSTVVNFDPTFTAFDMPMLFDDLDMYREATSDDHAFGPAYKESLGQYNFQLLGFWANGFLNPITTFPCAKITDLKGKTIRCMESAAVMKWLTMFGANPVPMAFSEVPTSLQTGAIDGTVLSATVTVSSGIADVIKDYTDWGMYICSTILVCNKDLFASLPTEYQDIINEVAIEAGEKLFTDWEASEVSAIETLKEKKVEIISSTPEEKQEWIDFCQNTIWPAMVEDGYITQEQLDEVRSLAK